MSDQRNKSKGNKLNRAKTAAKQGSLHPRNLHQGRYDLELLSHRCEELKPFIRLNAYNDKSIDFHNPLAVKALNKALLMHHYGIGIWDIPEGYLCPPIPGRADYIHYLADLLAEDNAGVIPCGRRIRGLDIGTGANCIYPIIGLRSYGWQFVGTDIDPVSVQTATMISDANPVLKGQIECRLQKNSEDIFTGLIANALNAGERFDFTLCNPPFHASAAEAAAGSQRKQRNLGRTKGADLNFGGQSNELWCQGGELAFIRRMINQSQKVAQHCYLFSCLVSKQENIKPLSQLLKKVGATGVRVVQMAQGQKVSRFITWRFLTVSQAEEWRKQRWGGQ